MFPGSPPTNPSGYRCYLILCGSLQERACLHLQICPAAEHAVRKPGMRSVVNELNTIPGVLLSWKHRLKGVNCNVVNQVRRVLMECPAEWLKWFGLV